MFRATLLATSTCFRLPLLRTFISNSLAERSSPYEVSGLGVLPAWEKPLYSQWLQEVEPKATSDSWLMPWRAPSKAAA